MWLKRLWTGRADARPPAGNGGRGFGLIEALIATGLAVCIAGGALSLLTAAARSWRTAASMQEVQHTARYAFDSMARDLRFARAVRAAGGRLELRAAKYGRGDQTIVYSMGVGARLMRNGQPATGESFGRVVIKDLRFVQINERLVEITLTAFDEATGRRFTAGGAAAALNVPPEGDEL